MCFDAANDHSFVTAVSQTLSSLFFILMGMLERNEKDMMVIGLDTAVYCQNEFCGVTHYFIIRPTGWLLTHLVVKPAKLPGIVNRVERLVAISQVSEISECGIWLHCSVDEFARLPLFSETHFIEAPASGDNVMEYDVIDLPSSSQTWMYVPITKYNIPHGELIISHQVQVEAKNGHLGQFKLLILDPDSFKITHLIFQRGHLWERKREMVSASVIDRLEGDTFYLTINKSEL